MSAVRGCTLGESEAGQCRLPVPSAYKYLDCKHKLLQLMSVRKFKTINSWPIFMF
jgi:hypothetical protein